MYSKNKLVLQLISLMKQFGIRKVVVSPGSRHFSLVHSLEADNYFQLYSVVDERSAAFFALGLIQQSGEAVAVACSSGTACMNYGSAVVEAFYQRLPLLVLSSDRLPHFLNQMEDQMYDQLDTFTHCTKYQGQLKEIHTDLDEWYCNRVINEALIELNHHGKGPVHLNIPLASHHGDTFSTLDLPAVRKISLIEADSDECDWKAVAEQIKNKKVMILWGQSVEITDALIKSVERFCTFYNAIIITDKISHLQCKGVIDNSIMALRAAVNFASDLVTPDVIISIGGNYIFNVEIKAFLPHLKFIHIQVGQESKVCDPFKKLTYLFEMRERTFFEKMCAYTNSSCTDYYECWKEVSDAFVEPQVEYSELSTIASFIHALPENVDLQIANSSSIRMVHMFHTHPSIRMNCNRGVNGIDGCMSTAVGYAYENDRPTFLVIGDLTFFYDMNALWNRQLSKNLRILLINNAGGAVMYCPLNEDMRKTLPPHIAAEHITSAQGWVESIGFTYMKASNQEEVNKHLKTLVDMTQEGPMLLEVFTEKASDVRIMMNYLSQIDDRSSLKKIVDKVMRRLKK